MLLLMHKIVSVHVEYIEAQNVTNSSLFIEVGSEEHKELWMSRLREVIFIVVSFPTYRIWSLNCIHFKLGPFI
jgi:hypothetical protein